VSPIGNACWKVLREFWRLCSETTGLSRLSRLAVPDKTNELACVA